MRPLSSSLAFLVLSACSSNWAPVDIDGDGYTVATGDCWENEQGPEGLSSADVHPGAAEIWYDGFDQDCSGGNDFDKDGDGHASVAHPDPTDALPSDDCWDDFDLLPDPFTADDPADQLDAAMVFPGALETWYDGIDQDCAGDDDFDQDGDGFASATHPGAGSAGDDCFDAVDDPFTNDAGFAPAEVNPAATDTWYDGTDADCGGEDDFDQDGDGYPRDLECDDLDGERFPDPGIAETWYDGIDDNCDGNDGDQDGDGYYVADYPFEVPEAYLPGDCWDDPEDDSGWAPLNGFAPFLASAAYPGAADTYYDGLDQDCAGDDDFDRDLDGFRTALYDDSSGVSGDDCDDTLATTNPAATEAWYDGVDADCAGDDDFDQDHDGYATDTDCDDVTATIHPGAAETCGDPADEDCDGSANDPGASGCEAYHADADSDGFGADTSACLCEAEGVYTETTGGDCDDGNAAVNPDGTESCATDADDDCDGSTNSVGATGCTNWYVDADADTYGSTTSQCACEAEGTYTAANDDDCNDALATVNPGRTEACNSVDDDCDSAVDEGMTLYYTDADDDDFGAGTGTCTSTGGRVSNDDDCDDSLATVYPGAPEYCDGEANDCDTSDSWSPSDEDQTVSYVTEGGAWSDVSSSFAAATAAAVELSSGTYNICAGLYYAKLIASSDTTDVIGVYGAAETTIDNNTSAGSTVSVTNGSVTLTGLTITGGHGSSGYGGGVIGNVTGTTPLTAPSLVLEECIVTGNTAGKGGGVSSYNSAWIKLVGTTVEANTATEGGGLYAHSGADLTLEDSFVEGNSSTGDGGGLYLNAGTLVLTRTVVADNVSGDDGGGLWIDTGTASCTSGGIYANTAGATSHGGGVYLFNHNSATALFTSSSCDFGTGADDNSPNDVQIKTGGSSYDDFAYGATASFVCSNATDLCIP